MQTGARLKLLHDRFLDALWPRRKILAALRERWGKPGNKDAWLESDYFDLARHRSPDAVVDDRTWLDLEYPQIFSDMDTTVTPIGSQMLFHMLRRYPARDTTPEPSYEAFETLRTNALLRESIQLRLMPLQDDLIANIASFLLDDPPQRMKHRGWLALWGLASLGVLGAVVFLGWSLWIWLGMVMINFVIIYKVSWHLHRDVHTLKSCIHMMEVADRFGPPGKAGRDLPMLARLHAESANRQRVRTTLSGFLLLQKPLVSYVSTWLNLMFLLETSIYNLAIGRFVRERENLLPTFELLGKLDASIAVASYLERHREHCRPELTHERFLALTQARHPLIGKPVENSIELSQRSALITGSNMAGKTTFIKTVGINILLGQTLGFCLAEAARIPAARVMSSIRGLHSVASGKSHYFAEIEAMRDFMDLQERGVPAVFLIDELFSGTNTVERVAAARAVLECLSCRGMVLVTTHDVELQSLMPERFELFHFQEDPDVEGFFDYRLRPGPATERNAIRLLARMGFPERVVADAMSYAGQEMPIPS